MSRVNSDLSYPRGFWEATRAYKTANAYQPWADMVMYNVQYNPLGAAVPGMFSAVQDSTGQVPFDTSTNRVNTDYWQLIRLNQ